jgi:hypothetical protein
MLLVHDGLAVNKESSTNEEAVQTSAQTSYDTVAKWDTGGHHTEKRQESGKKAWIAHLPLWQLHITCHIIKRWGLNMLQNYLPTTFRPGIV